MNDTLKGVAHIGAELAAAKADLQREMERHRKTWRQLEQVTGLLRDVYAYAPISEKFRIDAALSQQAEPVRCEYCDGTGDVHRADGEWLGECKECDAAEPAPAQTEQQPIQVTAVAVLRDNGDGGLEPDWILEGGTAELMDGMVLVVAANGEITGADGHGEVYAAPIAQTAPSCNHRFMYFGDQTKRRCADCYVVEGNEQTAPQPEQSDISADRAYRNGLQQGYNLGSIGDHARFQAVMNSYSREIQRAGR